MDVYSILQCVLYLDNPNSAEEFVNNGYVDVDTICKNVEIQTIFVFVNAFRNIFGCPPSYKIVRMYVSAGNLCAFIHKHWVFLKTDSISLAYSNALTLLKTPQSVKQEILSNMRHFSSNSDNSDQTSIIGMFLKTFNTKLYWNDVNDKLHESLFNWYNMYKCVKSSCVVSLAKHTTYSSTILDVIDNYVNTKLHVFNMDTISNDYMIHNNKHVLYPLKCYANLIELHDDSIKINNTYTVNRITNHIELHDELLTHVLKTANNTNTNVFWNHVIHLWNDLGHVQSFTPAENIKNAIIVIESRKNPLTIMSCLLSAKFLDKTKWRGFIFFCNTEHVDYYNKHLSPIIVKFITLDELSIKRFVVDDYNNLLKRPKIWDILTNMNIEKILIVQGDGFLIRAGAERFMEYDYVGAPWKHALDNSHNNIGVGNGGLSIRTVSVMKQISNTFNENEDFYKLFTQTPEDVFFSKNVVTLGYKLCPINIALHFSSEQVLTKGCCGVHKPWPYMSKDELDALFLSN